MIKLVGAEHVVQMYCAWGQQDSAGIYVVYIAMEIFERCLEDYLVARSEVDLTKSTIIFTELMTVVRSMHDAGVIHRDLKPSNVLMDSNGHIAITDFGTCAIKPYPYAEVSFFGSKDIGTQYCSDPVMGSTTVKHGEKVDVYSTGVTYSEMHSLNVSKRRKLIRDTDQKYKYGMKHRAHDFLKSSIWKDWGGDLGIVRLTLLIRARPSAILKHLAGRTESRNEQQALE
ncbi:hypothetical protein GQ55_9G101300 [Panicum hallii var. hallii]|uniref:non-specific serine/threonine protein kinase n=1 Tax=Panicum hallii var. hallii TaxID=1504633 RepID=A0A2T7C1J4_9POAL|nr:hypothetical protein GQ55_9G101300 [Panicum hallii var. hallii]PUZ37222.1 hypothetical protein GQ55_9G101300 [Panicum hallii var. hallii]